MQKPSSEAQSGRSRSSNAALLERYIKHLTRTKSPNTVYHYTQTTRSYVASLGRKSVRTATAEEMGAWLDRPRRGGAAAPATVRREVMELRSFYRFLHEQAEVIASNPARKLEPPPVQNDEPHPVEEAAWLATWRRELPDDMRVALGLGYFCGLRRHEITLLRAEQFAGPKIVAMKRKGGKKHGFPWRSCIELYSQRLPRLIGNPQTSFLGPLERLLDERQGRPALLPWDDQADPRWQNYVVHIKPEGLIDPNQFNKRLAKLGVEFRPHDLRHSFITNLVTPEPRGAGIPVQVASRLAGHADIRMTMRYLDTGADPLADFLNQDDGDSPLPTASRWGAL